MASHLLLLPKMTLRMENSAHVLKAEKSDDFVDYGVNDKIATV